MRNYIYLCIFYCRRATAHISKYEIQISEIFKPRNSHKKELFDISVQLNLIATDLKQAPSIAILNLPDKGQLQTDLRAVRRLPCRELVSHNTDKRQRT